MLCLGLFVFHLDTLSYQELQRRSSWKHATQSVVGARDVSQYLGPGEDMITLSGVVVPEYAGVAASLSVLRLMADQGSAWVLVEGTGFIYGAYVITEVQETRTLFFANGAARRIEFTVTLQRVDQDAIGTARQALSEAMGELGTLLQGTGDGLAQALGVG